jgi:ethanolaminephosphotransferase
VSNSLTPPRPRREGEKSSSQGEKKPFYPAKVLDFFWVRRSQSIMPFFSSYAPIRTYKTGATSEPSPLYQKVLKPMALKAVQYLPMWFAPNLLTLMGLACNIIQFAIVATVIPDMAREDMLDAPTWTPVVVAVFLFTYLMFDNMDGRQAVRTGASSPLGELLDHASDSLVIGLQSTGGAAFMQAGPWFAFMICLLGMPSFYSAHWLEFYTETLELPAWTGPTEAEVATIVGYIVAWFMGPEFWAAETGYTFYGNPIVRGMVPMILVPMISVMPVINNFNDIRQKCREQNKSMVDALTIPFPFLLMYISVIIWVIVDPSVVTNHPHMFISGVTIAFSYVTVEFSASLLSPFPVFRFLPFFY